MGYRENVLLASTGALLFYGALAHAEVLIDTGPPTGDLVSTLCTGRAGQVSTDSTLTISGIQNYVQVSEALVARITLRSDAGGLPGAVLFATDYPLVPGAEGYQGPSGLGWVVGPGDYWFTFEAPHDGTCAFTAARRRLGFGAEDPRPEQRNTAPPFALVNEAYLPFSGTLWEKNTTHIGWIVTGDSGPAVVGRNEWRQLTETSTGSLSWNKLTTVCSPITGACAGSLDGVSYDGWTWATAAETMAMFDDLIQPGSIQFPSVYDLYSSLNDADIASAARPRRFVSTYSSPAGHSVAGISRSEYTTERVSVPYVLDLPAPTGLDRAYAGNIELKGAGQTSAGAWLYRDVGLTLSLSASYLAGCKSTSGTVTISSPAPSSGVVVALSDTLVSASVPATVTIPAGSTSKTFSIKTVAVATMESGVVNASLPGRSTSRRLTLRPMTLTSVTLVPTSVVGGNPVVGKATLECNAGPGPVTVDLGSDSAVANTIASSVIVPQGLKYTNFDIATNTVLAKSYANIFAWTNTTTESKRLTVNVAAAVAPTVLKFGSVTVGQTSAPLTATLTNKGPVAFAVSAIGLTGTGAPWFAQKHDCPVSLAAGASCSITVTFKPLAASSKSAKLSISTSATSTPLSVSLSGTGI